MSVPRYCRQQANWFAIPIHGREARRESDGCLVRIRSIVRRVRGAVRNYVQALLARDAGMGYDCGTSGTGEARIGYPNSLSGALRLSLTSQTKDESPSTWPCPILDSKFDMTPMNATNTATSQPRGSTRSSLACLPCRSRHLKCDATRPQCNRCLEVARECQYAPSRRGGLDRAALAERRKRLALAGGTTAPDSMRIPGPSPQTAAAVQQDQQPPSRPELSDFPSDFSILEGNTLSNGTPVSALSSTHRLRVENIETDPLVTSYYKHFHKFHPFLLPRKAMMRIHEDATRKSYLAPVIAAMRLVGHLYAAQEFSPQLRDRTEICIAQASPTNPVLVQCRLLYSIVLFWHNFKAQANREIRTAVKLAVDLKMFGQEFASDHGAGHPALIECWRRTWWMLYIVDAYYAGTLGTMNFAVFDIDATVDLPCEEWEYESEVSTMIRFECVVSDQKADCLFQANSCAKNPGRL